MNRGANNVGFVNVSVAVLVHAVDSFNSPWVDPSIGIITVHRRNGVPKRLQEACLSVRGPSVLVVIKICRLHHTNTGQAIGEVKHLKSSGTCYRPIAAKKIRNSEAAARQFTQAIGIGFFVIIGGDDAGAFTT